jgi:Rha family phage regulatory protein
MTKVLVFKREERIVTDSLTVAKEFGKEHKNVLRAIENSLKHLPANFHQLNFELVEIIEKTPGGLETKSKTYNLTRDAWIYVVMGFTGKKAATVKLIFLDEFNRMEAELVGRGIQKAPLTQKEMLQMALSEIERLEAVAEKAVKEKAYINAGQMATAMGTAGAAVRKARKLERKLWIVETKLEQAEEELGTNGSMRTASAWMKEYSIRGISESQFGRKLAQLSRESDLPMGSVVLPRFTVKTYHEEAVRQYLHSL